MKVLWNMDNTTCVPIEKVSYFRIIAKQEAAGMNYYLMAFFPGNEGNFDIYVADNKLSCMKYLENL